MKRYMGRLLCLLLFAVLGLAACGDGNSPAADAVVLKIDGENITRSEYMVYLYTATQTFRAAAGEDVWNMDFDGQTADELLEDRTISTLQSVIVAKAYADENSITLTEEQKADAKQAADEFVAGVSAEDLAKMGIDHEGMYPLMEKSYLYSVVYQAIAAECEVDPAAMEQFYAENREQLRTDYTTLKLDGILPGSAEDAEAVAGRARSGEDFSSLFAEYDTAEGQENGRDMTMYQSYLQNISGLQEDWEPDDIIGPLSMNGKHFVFRVLEKSVPSDAEVKEIAETLYRDNVQAEYVESWMNNAASAQTVEKVEAGWETLEKFH